MSRTTQSLTVCSSWKCQGCQIFIFYPSTFINLELRLRSFRWLPVPGKPWSKSQGCISEALDTHHTLPGFTPSYGTVSFFIFISKPKNVLLFWFLTIYDIELLNKYGLKHETTQFLLKVYQFTLERQHFPSFCLIKWLQCKKNQGNS